MATPRGQQAVEQDRRAFTRLMWDTWSPAGWYTEQAYEVAAKAFDNPDWASIVLHSYRHRWGLVPGDPFYDADEVRLHPAPILEIPTLVLHGGVDTCNHPHSSKDKERFFTGRYERKVLDGIGHFPHREASKQVADAIMLYCGRPT